MNELIRLIDRWQRRRVIVVGDFMVDRNVYGNADRLSPDAPVPVLLVQREDVRPGGAANVCLCLAALDCDVECIGVVGDDAAGAELRHKLQYEHCAVSGLITDATRPTTVKQSLVGLAQHRHPQKMFRLDYENKQPVDVHIGEQLVDAVADRIADASALCLEDYDKGVLTPDLCRRLIELARGHNVPVLVDPAAISDYRKYAHATCITPNRTEAEKATGLEGGAGRANAAMARRLAELTDIEVIVLTLDRHGALLLRRGDEPRAIPTIARGVYDVTGAGDMVLAALTGAIANDADWPLAVRVANLAAGLEVERFGVVPVRLDQVLVAALAQEHDGGKLRSVEQLQVELEAHRRDGRTIVFTNGCFDILHAGHVRLLRQAKAQGDLLVLAVNSDASIRRLKGDQRPIVEQDDRLDLLAELQCIDYLVLFGDEACADPEDQDTPAPLIRALKPDVLVKGGDYAIEQIVGHQIVAAYGGKVVTIPLVQGRSTTHIVERIRAGATGK